MEYEIQGCGGVYTKPEGIFTSPNYPRPYPHDTHCQWVIEVEYGHLVEITFQDFDFEASQNCLQDGLTVRFAIHVTGDDLWDSLFQFIISRFQMTQMPQSPSTNSAVQCTIKKEWSLRVETKLMSISILIFRILAEDFRRLINRYQPVRRDIKNQIHNN